MIDLVGKILRMHRAFANADIPHAFGGALALAWCTAQARGTIDIDVNVFVGGEAIERVVAGLPKAVKCSPADVVVLRRELQHRLWWDHTPVDLFLNSTPYHDALAARVRWESFAGSQLPFLGCEDLAVFKVIFDRTKDWADLEAMRDAGTLDFDHLAAAIVGMPGADDKRLGRLSRLRVIPTKGAGRR